MAASTNGYADVNGARIYYETAGEGHPLVFVHAGIADSRMWDDQFAVFAKHYRVIRYDQRGYGKSEPVAGEFSFRDDLVALLRFLKIEPAYIVACSMGGGTAIDLCLEHAEMVDALALVCSSPSGLQLDVPPPTQFAEIEEAEKKGEWERINELETQIWVDGVGRTSEQVKGSVRARVLEMNRLALEHERKHLGSRLAPLQPLASEHLAELHLPVLVVIGDRDTAYSQAAGDYMAAHIAGARKAVITNTAHLPNMEEPEVFNQILAEFLESAR